MFNAVLLALALALLAAVMIEERDLKQSAGEGYEEYATVSEQGFTALAATNLDFDPAPDIWMINRESGLRNVVDDLSVKKGRPRLRKTP